MKKLVVLVVSGTVCALSIAALADATSQATWTAALTARQEVPKQVVKAPLAHGLFKGTLNGSKLSWTLTYSRLSGPATAAHIHIGAKGTAGNVLVPLCGGTPACKSGLKGSVTLTSAMTSAFKKHLLYVNVHTAKNPNGEIRGQILGM